MRIYYLIESMKKRSGVGQTALLNQSIELQAQLKQTKMELKEKDDILLKAKETIQELLQRKHDDCQVILPIVCSSPIKEPKISAYKEESDVSTQTDAEQNDTIPFIFEGNDEHSIDIKHMEQKYVALKDKLKRCMLHVQELTEDGEGKSKMIRCITHSLEECRSEFYQEQLQHNNCISELNDCKQKIHELQKIQQQIYIDKEKQEPEMTLKIIELEKKLQSAYSTAIRDKSDFLRMVHELEENHTLQLR